MGDKHMTKLIIDGKPIEAAPGATVMEAALANGIDIPRLCYHPDLVPSGGCRMCLVEIEGNPKPQASCGLQCAEGMVIHTETEQVNSIRHDVIDLLVSDHPLDCVTCDKAGSCDLQKYAYKYGITRTSFNFELSRELYQNDNPFFIRDHQYCILCGKCTRVCNEIVGVDAIEFAGRGFESHIATPFDGLMIDSSCVFCGSCVQVCPTAALMPTTRMGKGREWELERKRTICGYCGVGCSVEYALNDDGIVYAQSYPEAPVNGDFLCVKGRSGWDFISSPDRLTEPLVRKDLAYQLGLIDQPWELPETSALEQKPSRDNYIPVSWEQALDITADKLAGIISQHGGDAVAGLTSARCTNEDNYIFQKFMRVGVGTNSIDHCARL
jgi:predicted molibdopterin-dependent oxidoreductase YjgC